MRKIAIFGAGFIGKNLIKTLLKEYKDIKINVLDHNYCPDEFLGKVKWIRSGFENKECLVQVLEKDIDVAYHFISSTVPGDTENNIIKELYENVFTTVEFINLCITLKVKKVVFTSSSSVYGLQNKLPINELAQTNPISAHGIQKLVLEKYFQLFHYLNSLDVNIVRISNPYGPGQNIFGRQGFIAIAIGKLKQNEGLTIRNDGISIRDYIYIDDVINALIKIGNTPELPLIMNIGSGTGHSLNEVLDLIDEISQRKIIRLNGSGRLVDIPQSVLDISLANKMIGFKPCFTLSDGIRKTLKFHEL